MEVWKIQFIGTTKHQNKSMYIAIRKHINELERRLIRIAKLWIWMTKLNDYCLLEIYLFMWKHIWNMFVTIDFCSFLLCDEKRGFGIKYLKGHPPLLQTSFETKLWSRLAYLMKRRRLKIWQWLQKIITLVIYHYNTII